MGRIGLGLFVGLLVFGLSPLGAEDFSGRVVGVTDGDTITVLREGRGESIRLDGIDCPEKRQAFGNRAKQFTAALVFGKIVEVKTHGFDKYGRILGEVFLGDGTNVNRAIVRAGYAWWYRKYSDDETLERLEAEARSERVGLWVDPQARPPWEFRRTGRRQGVEGK